MPGARPSAQDSILQQVLSEFRAMNTELAALRVELKNFKENLDPIVKLIRGDGELPSIPTQIALLVEGMKTLREEVRENKDTIKEVQEKQDQQDSEREDSKSGRWILWTAVVTGVFGTIGTVTTGILQLTK